MPKVTRKHLIILGICVVVLFVALFLIGFIPAHRRKEALARQAREAASEPPVVSVVKPRASSDTIPLNLPASATAMQETALYARINGYLKRWTVDIGGHVQKGQLLAEISAPDIDAQLAQANAALLQARANLVQAQTNLDLATATYVRYKGLIPTGGVTQQELDERQTAMNAANATNEAAKASVKQAQANVQQLSAQQSFERIVAPFEGTVTARNFDVGALMSANDTTNGRQLFNVAQTDRLRVWVSIPQGYVSMVSTHEPVSFRVRNYPGRDFKGFVARTSGMIDPNTRTLLTECDFDNHEGLLWAGMYGEVHFDLHRTTPLLTIPTSAMLFEADGTQVAIVDSNNKIHFQKISPGRDYGTEIEVNTGLNGSERLVSNPSEQLVEGLKVNPQAPSAPPGTSSQNHNASNAGGPGSSAPAGGEVGTATGSRGNGPTSQPAPPGERVNLGNSP